MRFRDVPGRATRRKAEVPAAVDAGAPSVTPDDSPSRGRSASRAATVAARAMEPAPGAHADGEERGGSDRASWSTARAPSSAGKASDEVQFPKS